MILSRLRSAVWLVSLTFGAGGQSHVSVETPGPARAVAQDSQGPSGIDVSATLIEQHTSVNARSHRLAAAVLWLNPVGGTSVTAFDPRRSTHYTLVQKDKMFSPHLLVVPVGSKVLFPNQDPFFHNVFSLFDGRRFDLGLYEAGKTKEVAFSREGVSYIFCNIHPEMSAVVVALSTPLYSIADADGRFVVHGVAAGEYEVHLWSEATPQAVQSTWVRHVLVSPTSKNLGTFIAGPDRKQQHLNKFGRPYDAPRVLSY